MTRGAIVPHAPLLLPSLSSPEVEEPARRIRSAVRDLTLAEVEVVILVSPHGAHTGIYQEVSGSLDDHGVDGVSLTLPRDGAYSDALARAWGRPLLAEPIDHGVLVPAALLDLDRPVVAAALAERGPTSETIADARALARALDGADNDVASCALVASANASVALSPRAPLAERADALAAERALLDALEGAPEQLADAIPPLARDGRSCGLGPLSAFAALFSGWRLRMLAYEVPVGVGYLVAEAQPAAT